MCVSGCVGAYTCVLASSSHSNNEKLKRQQLAGVCVCVFPFMLGGGLLLICLYSKCSDIVGCDIQYIMWAYEGEMGMVTGTGS